MRVALICPAPPGSRLGNRITALRWARLLRALGHSVTLAAPGALPRCDLLIALHARRSAASVFRAQAERPGLPIVVALTGTDLYRDIHTDAAAQRALALAARLIVLHPGAERQLPQALRARVRVVQQSAPTLAAAPGWPLRAPSLRGGRRDAEFTVAVVGHLRPEKDPLRAALAARLLPGTSGVRVLHAGRALDAAQARAARAEQRGNPRYRWLGELTPGRARQLIGAADLLCLTSSIEGGANVVSEALAARTPILATRIPSVEGVLGPQHPGLFAVGDTEGLARLLLRAESEPAFLDALRRSGNRARAQITPARERAALRALLRELETPRAAGRATSSGRARVAGAPTSPRAAGPAANRSARSTP